MADVDEGSCVAKECADVACSSDASSPAPAATSSAALPSGGVQKPASIPEPAEDVAFGYSAPCHIESLLRVLALVKQMKAQGRKRQGSVLLGQLDASGTTLDVLLGFDKSACCFKLMFVCGSHRVGFVLMEACSGGSLAMRGMRVNDEFRGTGLAKLFIGVWIRFCLYLELTPRTIKIIKPLVCLSLQNLGFVPEEGAVPVEVGSQLSSDGKLLLWSQDPRLRSTFSNAVLKSQGLRIAAVCPTPSKTAYIGAFSCTNVKVLEQAIKVVELLLRWPQQGTICC
eukprot:NODE_5764_length_912_cov_32.614702_g5539_i0.p1 GENE.NODE_5764_length_912_cov_32.614702_g5539_i0~~NODE_5764_length_912_cov_32.614702_g5539_i0.p1  ORF type:complete len:283 (+),score=27.75 NODE_5764_length_912_cov_32.614702_g5539_i0:57-905(+)